MAPPIPETGPEVMIGVITAIAVFLTISILLGFFMRKKAKNFEEWLVGRRDIGPLVTGFALVASYLSGWAIFGNAGLGYAYGWFRKLAHRNNMRRGNRPVLGHWVQDAKIRDTGSANSTGNA